MANVSIKTVLSGTIQQNHLVEVAGWVRTRRDSKAGFSFISLYDGSCFASLQVVASNELSNYQTDILSLTTGCSLQVTGVVVQSLGKGQAYELQASKVKVIGLVADPNTYPMAAKRHSVEFLREQAHLRPRTNLIGAVARVRSCLANAIHDFFYRQGYLWISTPIITSADAEGAGELFRVSTLDLQNLPITTDDKIDFQQDFFGKETFLTVSGQLNAEAYACALSKVYTFGPTFRAENSNTSRHLAEFWMVEPEVAFADLTDIGKLAESLLKHILTAVLAQCAEDMQFFNKQVNKQIITRLTQVINAEFTIMDYSQAIDVLASSGCNFKYPVTWGADLQSEHERYLAEQYVQGPIIIQNYPKDIKAFYMRSNDDGKTVAAMDLLVPGIGEIIGGAQREERLNILDCRIKERGLFVKDYAWYRDLRRYGTVPHAGFGLGFERLVAYVTGVSNVRDVIAFPRTPGNAEF